MKPLPSAPLTEEDQRILAWVVARITGVSWSRPPAWHADPQDRRDAELMLSLADCRSHPGGYASGQLGLGEFGHPMPSLVSVTRYFPHRPDITYFA
jgi:hypothetical protein